MSTVATLELLVRYVNVYSLAGVNVAFMISPSVRFNVTVCLSTLMVVSIFDTFTVSVLVDEVYLPCASYAIVI